MPHDVRVVHRGIGGALPQTSRRRARAVAVAAALTLVLLATTYVAARAGAGRPDRCERFAAASVERAAIVTGSGRDVLVVGDSYSAGLGLSQLGRSWPARLPGRVHVAGFSGSGFSRGASPCGDQSFATRARAALGPHIKAVVVQGGLNDVDQPRDAVIAGFERLIRVVGDRPVVVVGPPNAPARAPGVPAVDRLLRDLAERHGAAYVGTTGLTLPYLDDRLHLTPRGHRLFGDAVAAHLHR